MAIIKAVNSRASIGHAINYITQKSKTTNELKGGYNCNHMTALDEMKDTKLAWNKTNGRQYKHFVQSFPSGDYVHSDLAFTIAKELVEKSPLFKGYEVCFATHTDRPHIHTHIIVNSVSFETGKKFRYSKKELQEFKDLSDEILKKYYQSICTKENTTTNCNMNGYQTMHKAQLGKYKSWVFDIMESIKKATRSSKNKTDFIENMKSDGITVSWEDKRKYITFTDKDGNKIRNKKLSDTFKLKLDKSDFEEVFEENSKLCYEQWKCLLKPLIEYNDLEEEDEWEM